MCCVSEAQLEIVLDRAITKNYESRSKSGSGHEKKQLTVKSSSV